MINIVQFNNSIVSEQLSYDRVEDIPSIETQTPASFTWIDLQSENVEVITSFLNRFSINSLAIEDALRKRHPSKVEFFDEHLFILYRGIKEVNDNISFDHQMLALFVQEGLLVTLHPAKSMGIQKTIATLPKLKDLSPLKLALTIMKSASGVYLENLLNFDTVLNEKEELLENNANDTVLKELTSYKAKLVKLIRTFNYHTAISEGLLKETESYAYFCKSQCEHAIIDLEDRFNRLHSLAQMHYDICGDLIDGYLSISAHQLNDTMRILTVITAIFVPLGFLAGLYGMNFDYIPELKVEHGYFYLIGTMSLIAGSLVYFFKKRRWL